MSIIDNTNPKHVLSWCHVYDGRYTVFACSCKEFEHKVDTPPTLRDAQFAQRVAIEKFNDHVTNLGKAEVDIISDAVIVNEVPIGHNFSKMNDLTFINRTTPSGRTLDENDSSWRDSHKAAGCEENYSKTQNFGRPPPEYTRQYMEAMERQIEPIIEWKIRTESYYSRYSAFIKDGRFS